MGQTIMRRVIAPGLVLTVAMILLCTQIASAVRRNVASVLLLRAQGERRPVLQEALRWLDNEASCRGYWLRGWARNALGDGAGRDAEWEQLLACDPASVALVEAYFPDDWQWAQRALVLAPQAAESWFWLARVNEGDNPEEAIRLYQRGLALNPRDTPRWNSLGFLLGRSDPDAAFAAFVESCNRGGKGCRWAGAIAERRGDLRLAMHFYRRDPSPDVHRWADRLEEELRRIGEENP